MIRTVSGCPEDEPTMLTLVEALNYRCLRYVRRPLSPFQVMVGPNASGKTTFLDRPRRSSSPPPAVEFVPPSRKNLEATTLLAYLPDLSGIILIEEPENGIHPKAVEAVFQSLRSVRGAQILLATHSPVILAMAEPADVLCFAKDDEGATDIVTGLEHPALREWKGDPSLGTLFAGGVLG